MAAGDSAAASLGYLMTIGIPIGRPFPDVADHVECAVAIGGKLADRSCAGIPVGHQILNREFALPVVGEHPPLWGELVAPGESLTFEAGARRKLPLRLSRDRFLGPG